MECRKGPTLLNRSVSYGKCLSCFSAKFQNKFVREAKRPNGVANDDEDSTKYSRCPFVQSVNVVQPYIFFLVFQWFVMLLLSPSNVWCDIDIKYGLHMWDWWCCCVGKRLLFWVMSMEAWTDQSAWGWMSLDKCKMQDRIRSKPSI